VALGPPGGRVGGGALVERVADGDRPGQRDRDGRKQCQILSLCLRLSPPFAFHSPRPLLDSSNIKYLADYHS